VVPAELGQFKETAWHLRKARWSPGKGRILCVPPTAAAGTIALLNQATDRIARMSKEKGPARECMCRCVDVEPADRVERPPLPFCNRCLSERCRMCRSWVRYEKFCRDPTFNLTGRPRGPRMKCGWGCGTALSGHQMRAHFKRGGVPVLRKSSARTKRSGGNAGLSDFLRWSSAAPAVPRLSPCTSKWTC
jgi:hypothetical protein